MSPLWTSRKTSLSKSQWIMLEILVVMSHRTSFVTSMFKSRWIEMIFKWRIHKRFHWKSCEHGWQKIKLAKIRKDVTCSPRLAKNGTASLPMTVTLAALVTNEAATSIPLKNYLDDHPFGNIIHIRHELQLFRSWILYLWMMCPQSPHASSLPPFWSC